MSMKNSHKPKTKVRDLVVLTLLLLLLPAIVLAAVFNFNLFTFASRLPNRDLIGYTGDHNNVNYKNGLGNIISQTPGVSAPNSEGIPGETKVAVAVEMKYAPYFIETENVTPKILGVMHDRDISGNMNTFKNVFNAGASQNITSKADMPTWMDSGQKFNTTLTFKSSLQTFMGNQKRGFICIWVDAHDLPSGTTDVIKNESNGGKNADDGANVYCKDFTPNINLTAFTGKADNKEFKKGLYVQSLSAPSTTNPNETAINGFFAVKNVGKDALTRGFTISFLVTKDELTKVADFKTAYQSANSNHKSTYNLDLMTNIGAGKVVSREIVFGRQIKEFIMQNKSAFVCLYADSNEVVLETPENNDNIGCQKVDPEWDVAGHTGLVAGQTYENGLLVASEIDKAIQLSYVYKSKFGITPPTSQVAVVLANRDLSGDEAEFKKVFDQTDSRFKTAVPMIAGAAIPNGATVSAPAQLKLGLVASQAFYSDNNKVMYKCAYFDYKNEIPETTGEGGANVVCKREQPNVDIEPYTGAISGVNYTTGLALSGNDEIKLAVKNLGPHKLAEDFKLKVVLSGTQVKDDKQFNSAYDSANGKYKTSITHTGVIDANGVSTRNFKLGESFDKVFDTFTSTNIYACLYVDADKQITERVGLNDPLDTRNIRCIEIPRPKVDLVALSGTHGGQNYRAGLAGDGAGMLKVAVKNVEKDMAKSSQVRVLMTQKNVTGSVADFEVEYQKSGSNSKAEANVSALAQNEVATTSVYMSDYGQLFGNYFYCTMVDSSNVNKETNDGDKNVTCTRNLPIIVGTVTNPGIPPRGVPVIPGGAN